MFYVKGDKALGVRGNYLSQRLLEESYQELAFAFDSGLLYRACTCMRS